MLSSLWKHALVFTLASTVDATAGFVRCRGDAEILDGPIATGILHFGAHGASEASIYNKCVGSKVLFFECDPLVATVCQRRAEEFGQRCVKACLSNETKEAQFHVLGEARMSSSLMKLTPSSTFPDGHPDNAPTSTVRTVRYDEWKRSIPVGLLPANMNTLVVDTQGMEYEVIQGMGHELDSFEVLLVEVSSVAMYQGQRLAHEMDEFLATKGFYCVNGCAPCGFCDRVYRRGSAQEYKQSQIDSIADVAETGNTLLNGIAQEGFFPCSASGVALAQTDLRLDPDTGEPRWVQVPIEMANFKSWEALHATLRPQLLAVCLETSPWNNEDGGAGAGDNHGVVAKSSPLRQHGSDSGAQEEEEEGPSEQEVEATECASVLEANVNAWIVTHCQKS